MNLSYIIKIYYNYSSSEEVEVERCAGLLDNNTNMLFYNMLQRRGKCFMVKSYVVELINQLGGFAYLDAIAVSLVETGDGSGNKISERLIK